eukprot:gene8516-10838_t
MSVTDFSYFERPAGGSLICLQYGDVAEDLDAARAAGIAMHHWAEAITDLDEFSALISALDGVVTVCNTTVHYAGALGKPVWVLAPKPECCGSCELATGGNVWKPPATNSGIFGPPRQQALSLVTA